MVLELTTQTTMCLTENKNLARPSQIIKTQKEKYQKHWTDTTTQQSKLECFLTPNELAEYRNTVSDPKIRKVTEHRLSEHSLTIETSRWFGQTDRPGYQRKISYVPTAQKKKWKQNFIFWHPVLNMHKLGTLSIPFHNPPQRLPSETKYGQTPTPASSNMAARYVRSCLDERASRRTVQTTESICWETLHNYYKIKHFYSCFFNLCSIILF